jgi:predicted RecA/RadA family phage recombinase
VVQGSFVGIAKTDIAASTLGALSVNGVFDVDKNTEALTAGSGIYWDADGSSVSGTATEGAATATASGNTFMGFAQSAATTNAAKVRIALRSAETVAGGVATATSITGTASTLPIAGLAVASGSGGAVSLAGGAGTAANANGGAVSVLGGAKNGDGTAGAVNIGTSNSSGVTIGATDIPVSIPGVATFALAPKLTAATAEGAIALVITNGPAACDAGKADPIYLTVSVGTNSYVIPAWYITP